MQRQTLKPFPEEPNTDTVPAMLTPGEFVIRKDAVDAIGVDKLNLMNNIDRLSMLSSLMEYRPSGYQEGGEVISLLKDTMAKYGSPVDESLYTPQGSRTKLGLAKYFNIDPEEIEIDTLSYSKPGNLRAAISKKNNDSFSTLYEELGLPLYVDTQQAMSSAIPDLMMRLDASKELRSKIKNIQNKNTSKKDPLKEMFLKLNPDVTEEEYDAMQEFKKRRGMQEGGEVMLKTNKENLPNPGLKALFDSGAKGKEALENMGFQDGGKVMNYYGGGRVMDMMNPNMMRRGMMGGGKVESDALSVFGDKSAAADKMNIIMTLQSMRMQQGGMVPGMIPPQMPGQSLPPAGMMMQEGGMVEQPMPQGEMSDVDMSMMPDAERAFPSEPMEQMNLKPNEMMAYQEYGPESFRYMAPKFKPRAEFTPYDAMVDAGIVDPYETSEDDFVVMTRDMANNLRGMNGV